MCHGAPGVLPMLTVAVELFPKMRDDLISAALKAGKKTWKYGLILKGNGLCHGISGNGYALHSLFRMFTII